MPAFWTKWQRAVIRLWYWDIWHLRPTAPVNWRYMLPSPSERIRLFRALWWNSRYKLPGLLWLPLELLRCVHWRVWATERSVQSALSVYGDDVQARFGISLQEQQLHVKHWAKTWCIDPFTSYHWQLYGADANALAWVYENQTSAFHALQNQISGANKTDHRLLSDKIALAEILAKQGIPMVETAQVSCGYWSDLEAAFAKSQKLFCKLRSGNQGESAFSVWRSDNGLQGLAHDGRRLQDEAAVRQAWNVLSDKGQMLIQAHLENHPTLVPAAADGVVITLRVVTKLCSEGVLVWWAELQVPSEVPARGSRGFWRFPVSIADGRLSKLSRDWLLKQAWQDEYDALWQLLSVVENAPYWERVFAFSHTAHQNFPRVWAIAWDWVLTPDGPILLEGNSGWDLQHVQQQGIELMSQSVLSTHRAQ